MRGSSSILALLLLANEAHGCSNLLIPGGSSTDGSTIISYSADDGNLMGDLYNWPKAKHAQDELREIWSWDEGTHLGAIPQPAETFNVVGNTNEHQLTIGETTFGGLSDLNGAGGRAVCDEQYGCVDYGQLIWVTLQRAKNAREAIDTMDYLMQTYGYASSGESFSIADPYEVWLLEVVGKGPHAKGSVWVATKIPDGYVCAHANQARIRTFPRDQPAQVLFAEDVVDFPRSIGLYNGSDSDFSFSDTFDPVNFASARACEARVFSFFSAVAAPEVEIEQYLDYAQGYNLTNRMPLYIKTATKISVNDTLWHMRNHYEGTWFDPRPDVGAGAWGLPNRLGEGLSWSYKGDDYVNERPIGTQYAAWNFVGNQRPTEKYSVLWFGVDDSTFSLHTPIYGVTARVPTSWSGSNCTGRDACKEALGLPGTMLKFSMRSQHWVQNLISNYAYSRYDQIAPVVHQRLIELEGRLFNDVKEMDAKLKKMQLAAANTAASDFSYDMAQEMHEVWADYFGKLFQTFVDGFTASPDPTNAVTGCAKETPHFSERWKKLIVETTGDHYKVPKSEDVQDKAATIDKFSLRALGGTGS